MKNRAFSSFSNQSGNPVFIWNEVLQPNLNYSNSNRMDQMKFVETNFENKIKVVLF